MLLYLFLFFLILLQHIAMCAFLFLIKLLHSTTMYLLYFNCQPSSLTPHLMFQNAIPQSWNIDVNQLNYFFRKSFPGLCICNKLIFLLSIRIIFTYCIYFSSMSVTTHTCQNIPGISFTFYKYYWYSYPINTVISSQSVYHLPRFNSIKPCT